MRWRIPGARWLRGAALLAVLIAGLAGARAGTAGRPAGAGPAQAAAPGDLAGHWALPVVAALADLGIAPAGPEFRPGEEIRYSDWAAWLCAAAGWPGEPDCQAAALAAPVARAEALAEAGRHASTAFAAAPAVPADVRGHRLEAGVLGALRAGLVRGYPDGTLRPDRALTRAEAAVILGRLVVNRREADPWRLEPHRQTPLDRLRLRLHPELAGPHRYVTVHTAEGQLVAARVRVAETRLQRMVGAESGLGEGLLLLDTAGIHTRWGPVPLDVIFLDGQGRAVGVYRELPRDVERWGQGAVSALELPGGTIARLLIGAGDVLRIAPAE